MYRSYSLGFYQKGGATKTVAQQWKEKTGLDWSEARRLGFTDGSYEGNIKLASQLGTDEFDNQLEAQFLSPTNNMTNAQRLQNSASRAANLGKKFQDKVAYDNSNVQGVPNANATAVANAVAQRNEAYGHPTVSDGRIPRTYVPVRKTRNDIFIEDVKSLGRGLANALPRVGETVASVVGGPVLHAADMLSKAKPKPVGKVYRQHRGKDEPERALNRANAINNTVNGMVESMSKGTKPINSVMVPISTGGGGVVMLPVPVNVGAYKKFRDGGYVTVEELLGY